MIAIDKEFWDDMRNHFPKAVAKFEDWFQVYKQENNWEILFNAGWFNGFATMANIKTGAPLTVIDKHKTPEYYDLPRGMQLGIFIEYIRYWLYRKDYRKDFIMKTFMEMDVVIYDWLEFMEHRIES